MAAGAGTGRSPGGSRDGSRDGWRGDGRVAEAGMAVEAGPAAAGDIVAGGFEAVVDALREDGGRSVRRWRPHIDGLGVRAAGEKREAEEGCGCEVSDQGLLRGSGRCRGLQEETRIGGKVAAGGKGVGVWGRWTWN